MVSCSVSLSIWPLKGRLHTFLSTWLLIIHYQSSLTHTYWLLAACFNLRFKLHNVRLIILCNLCYNTMSLVFVRCTCILDFIYGPRSNSMHKWCHWQKWFTKSLHILSLEPHTFKAMYDYHRASVAQFASHIIANLFCYNGTC